MNSVDKYLLTVNPFHALNEGWLKVLRLRFLLFSGLIFILSALLLLETKHIFQAYLVFLIGLSFVLIIYIIRVFTIQRLRVGDLSHQLCHYVRDEVINIVCSVKNQNEYSIKYKNFNNDVAEKIALLFRSIVNDISINCGIRLAQEIEGNNYYVTVGRSKGLDPKREKISVPISGDEGMPLLLRSLDKKGVFVVRDINQAIKDKLWKPSESDRFSDLKTLMIAPINGFVDGQKSMIGILYITSKNNVFKGIHTDSCKATADFLGTIYPIITIETLREFAK